MGYRKSQERFEISKNVAGDGEKIGDTTGIFKVKGCRTEIVLISKPRLLQ